MRWRSSVACWGTALLQIAYGALDRDGGRPHVSVVSPSENLQGLSYFQGGLRREYLEAGNLLGELVVVWAPTELNLFEAIKTSIP